MSDLTDLAVESTTCPYCGARPGEFCVTRIAVTRGMSRESAIKHYGPSGRSSYLHAARIRPIRDAFMLGIRAGQHEATS